MSQGRSNRNKPNEKKKPWGDAYYVQQLSEDRSNWIKLGTAWRHEDGQGFDFTLDAEPNAWRDPSCERRIVIRKRTSREGDT